MKAKGALQRAGKSLGYDHLYINDLSKKLDKFDVDDDTEYTDKELQYEILNTLNGIADGELLDLAKEFVGIIQSFGTHASCVIVSNQDIRKFCSIERQGNKDGAIYVASCNFKHLESMGLLKEDILGLKTLDVIHECLSYLDDPPNVSKLPWEDKDTVELLRKGDTLGVFQMKSAGMVRTLRQVRPTGFRDLISVVALYRPACILTGILDEYIKRKNGEPYEFLDERLKEPLGETYGLMVFQEQVMATVQAIAGYSMSESDTVRRAVGKKDHELMATITKEFVERAIANGTKKEVAEEILTQIIASASYSFNKGHSQAYGYMAWVTAYLKAHYPIEFFVATINSEHGNQEKIIPFIQEIQRKSISILPPCLKASEEKWTIENGSIRVGLNYIKGIGKIEKPKEYTIDCIFKTYNKNVLVSLIKAGALDFLDKDRAKLYSMVEQYKNSYNEEKRCMERIEHFTQELEELRQLYRNSTTDKEKASITKKAATTQKRIESWRQKLQAIEYVSTESVEYPTQDYEYEVLGIRFDNPLKDYHTAYANGFDIIAAIVHKFEKRIDKNGREMAFVTTHTGKRYVMFASNYVELQQGVGYYLQIYNNDKIGKTKELQKIVA